MVCHFISSLETRFRFTAAEGDELQMLDVNGLDIGGVWFPLGFERFNPTASTENGELGEIFVAAAPLAGEMAGFYPLYPAR